MMRRSAGPRSTSHVVAPLAATLIATALASCRDAVTDPAPTSAVHAVRRDGGTVPMPDAGFDPNDTYAQVELYVEHSYDVAFDSAVVDPTTGAETTTLHIDAPTDHLLLEAGYDVTGVPRFAVTNLAVSADASQGLVDVAQRTVGGPNDLTAYGPDGVALDATPQIGAPPGDNPFAMLGLDATTNVVEAIALEAGSVAPSALRTPPTTGAGVATSASPLTAGGPADSTVDVRTTSADGGTVTRHYRRGQDGVARLSALEIAAEQRTGARPTRLLTRMRVARLTVRAVAARDAARAARRAARGPHGSSSGSTGPNAPQFGGPRPNGLGRTPASTGAVASLPSAVICATTSGCVDPSPDYPPPASPPALFYGFAGEGCSYYSYCPPPLPNGNSDEPLLRLVLGAELLPPTEVSAVAAAAGPAPGADGSPAATRADEQRRDVGLDA